MPLEEWLLISDATQVEKVLNALSSRAKLRVLRILYEKGGATAKEIAEELGVKIPTVLEHLQELVAAGVVTVDEVARGGRRTKVYRLRARRVVIEVDLASYTERERAILEELLKRYLNLRHYGYRVRAYPSIREVKRLLGVDEDTAKLLVSHIRSRVEQIADTLVEELLEMDIEELNVAKIVELLRVDHSLAAMVATRMIERGIATAERGRIRIVKKG